MNASTEIIPVVETQNDSWQCPFCVLRFYLKYLCNSLLYFLLPHGEVLYNFYLYYHFQSFPSPLMYKSSLRPPRLQYFADNIASSHENRAGTGGM